jgi:hypothetical protein
MIKMQKDQEIHQMIYQSIGQIKNIRKSHLTLKLKMYL